MGCSFSRRPSSSFNNIVRVVYLNGHVEDFDYPISVGQLIAGDDSSQSQQFVCTPTQLMSKCCKGLQHDTMLEVGHVYFLLPYSTLQGDVSAVTLASIAKRLTAKAKSTQWNAKAAKPSQDGFGRSSSVSNSPGKDGLDSGMNTVSSRPKGLWSIGVRPWKPILDTIREKSFNRRESDLQSEKSFNRRGSDLPEEKSFKRIESDIQEEV